MRPRSCPAPPAPLGKTRTLGENKNPWAKQEPLGKTRAPCGKPLTPLAQKPVPVQTGLNSARLAKPCSDGVIVASVGACMRSHVRIRHTPLTTFGFPRMAPRSAALSAQSPLAYTQCAACGRLPGRSPSHKDAQFPLWPRCHLACDGRRSRRPPPDRHWRGHSGTHRIVTSRRRPRRAFATLADLIPLAPGGQRSRGCCAKAQRDHRGAPPLTTHAFDGGRIAREN